MDNQNTPTLYTDDMCLLCNGFVQFIFKIDKKEQIHFAKLTDVQKEKNSLIFCTKGKEYQQSDAVIKLFEELGSVWKVFAFFMSIFPKFFRNYIYNWIANNRYRFGKQKCALPTDKQKSRILTN